MTYCWGAADLNVDVRGEVGTDERVVYVEDMVLDHALPPFQVLSCYVVQHSRVGVTH